MENDLKKNMLVPLGQEQMISIRGGSEGWDYEIAKAMGKGFGFSLRKLARMLKFLSENLYEMQANTQVIYK